MSEWESNEEIKIFREYLRIPSVHPNVDYDGCVAFLQKQATRLNLPIVINYPAHPKKPVVILTWLGTHPELPSIMLNSHMDVVPVFEEYWTHPPFAADLDSDGRIYGRGTQDMKSYGCQYLSAVHHLKMSGIKFKRTVHIVFVPDEEIGSKDGMKAFVETSEFAKLNIGFALDEGKASGNDVCNVYYAERSAWCMVISCHGTSGHGSVLLENTAGEKFRYIIDKFLDFRESEAKKLENDPKLIANDITVVNLTVVNGGVQPNVVPPVLTVAFDVRLAIDVDHDEFESVINGWCEEAGGGIEIFYERKEPQVAATKLDESNPFWIAFKDVLNDLNLKIATIVCGGATDGRFVRGAGIPVLGFSCTTNTPILLHAHDEFIGVSTFLDGIEIYKKLLLKLANV